MTNDRIRTVLVHRNAAMAKALALLLEESGRCEVLATANNAKDALSAASRTSPQVVLMDPELPDVDLNDVVSQMKEAAPNAYMVSLTGSNDPAYLRKAISAGMTAYLTTAAEPEELINKLVLAAQGHVLVSGRIATGLSGLAQTTTGPAPNGGSDVLTNRERDVIELASHGSTNRQIADKLVVTENTVKVHLRNIYRKLGVQNRHQLTALAHRSGLYSQD